MEMGCVEVHRVQQFAFKEERKRKKKKKKKAADPFKAGTPWNCDGEILWLAGGDDSDGDYQLPVVTVQTYRQLVPVFAVGPNKSLEQLTRSMIR